MSKCTPAPWKYDRDDKSIRADSSSAFRRSAMMGDYRGCIVSTFERATGDRDNSVDDLPTELDANANLIAAAPEMYEALKEMLEWCIWDTEYVARAKAALAKADGGQQ